MALVTIRTIYVNGTEWNAFVEDGEWVDFDSAQTGISAQCNVHPCSVKLGKEYTDPEATCTTVNGQRVRETLTVLDR